MRVTSLGSSTLVVDLGGSTLKCGLASSSQPRVLPNCITKAKSEKRRAFVADQVDECRDLSSLYFLLPFQRGYLVKWEHERRILDHVFSRSCMKVDTNSSNLIVTEPYFNFKSIQEGMQELFFEQYEFKSLLRLPPADLACYLNRLEHLDQPCCLVIDAGYSFTHVVPFVRGRRVSSAIRRLDVGGKLLTNHLKEIVSYRQLHVMDETHVINDCKEDCCYVSLDYSQDMRKAAIRDPTTNCIARDYVLPDFTSLRRGVMKSLEESSGRPRENEQIIRLSNERFSVPELLFRPSDIGLNQMGVAELAAHVAVDLCDPEATPFLLANIVLIGGSVLFENFAQRFEHELRQFVPQQYQKINVRVPEDPVAYAWQGGSELAKDPVFPRISVSREEYFEKGHAVCQERFF